MGFVCKGDCGALVDLFSPMGCWWVGVFLEGLQGSRSKEVLQGCLGVLRLMIYIQHYP